jgi:hypothetical protein
MAFEQDIQNCLPKFWRTIFGLLEILCKKALLNWGEQFMAFNQNYLKLLS